MRRSVNEPMLITSAAASGEDEFGRRRRKYAIMMGTRVLCVIAAGLTYQISLWLALALMVGGVVLPWCAVIIANDRPVKRRAPVPVHHGPLATERALPPGPLDGRTVDG